MLGGQTPPRLRTVRLSMVTVLAWRPPPGSKGPMTLRDTHTVSSNYHKAVHAAFYAAFFSINKVHTCQHVILKRVTREGHISHGSRDTRLAAPLRHHYPPY